MTANAHLDATIVETRRLELLRRIADSGGRISPVAEPQAKHGYRYEAPVETSTTIWPFFRGKTISRRDFSTG
jgi:hypothetical protein